MTQLFVGVMIIFTNEEELYDRFVVTSHSLMSYTIKRKAEK